MIEYFWIGIKAAWEISVFRYMIFSLLILYIILFLRRLTIALQSGGAFSAPYQISNEKFYIHNALCSIKRIIPLKEIKLITINCIRVKRNSGRRYILHIEKEQGRTVMVIFGKTKKNDKLINNLKKETKRYAIRISKGLYD